MNFVYCFQSEWLKKKRSLASWLVLIGGFFTPSIVIIARIIHSNKLYALSMSSDFWEILWKNSWESMAIFILPMGIILATSLIVQLEFKNNAWKQLHTVPQKMITIFSAKLAVILVMMLQLFILFNIGIYLSGVIPVLIFWGTPYPKQSIPFLFFFKEDVKYFVDCLPILALQYLISLRFKNFLVPVGVGFALLIAALGGIKWKYGYIIPYTYSIFNYLISGGYSNQHINIHLLAICYFAVFTIAGYFLYITNKERG